MERRFYVHGALGGLGLSPLPPNKPAVLVGTVGDMNKWTIDRSIPQKKCTGPGRKWGWKHCSPSAGACTMQVTEKVCWRNKVLEAMRTTTTPVPIHERPVSGALSRSASCRHEGGTPILKDGVFQSCNMSDPKTMAERRADAKRQEQEQRRAEEEAAPPAAPKKNITPWLLAGGAVAALLLVR